MIEIPSTWKWNLICQIWMLLRNMQIYVSCVTENLNNLNGGKRSFALILHSRSLIFDMHKYNLYFLRTNVWCWHENISIHHTVQHLKDFKNHFTISTDPLLYYKCMWFVHRSSSYNTCWWLTLKAFSPGISQWMCVHFCLFMWVSCSCWTLTHSVHTYCQILSVDADGETLSQA